MANPVAVILCGLFRTQVALFASDEKRLKYYRKVIGFAAEPNGQAAYGSCHVDHDQDGKSWFSIVLNDDASIFTLVHECSHMVDFLCEIHGVPINADNTEVRAYMLAQLFEDASDELGFTIDRNQ